MSFTELPHTADVKMRVCAPSPDSLFSEACMALMQVMYGSDRKTGLSRELDLDAENTDAQLLDFLSEVLFIADAESFVIAHADIQITGTHVHAILDGEPFDRARHNKGTEVKGISYSGMSIRREQEGYVLEIIFDV